jgi:hypothetical protein
MRFERDTLNPETGDIKFEGIEQDIVTKAILTLLKRASSAGGEQVPDYEAEILDLYIRMLMPKHYGSGGISYVRAKHFHALSRTLEASIPELPEEEQAVAQGMAGWLDLHRDMLEHAMSDEEIDAQVSQASIPDNLEGIA